MKFLDLFSGVGGFRAGFELAGHECVGHCEIDPYADRSYRAIFNVKESEWFANDITNVRPSDVPQCDIITAGFPCQDVSIAGNRAGLDGARSSLFFEVLRLIEGKDPEDRPEWLVLENVKNLLSIGGGRDFTTVLSEISEIGYRPEYQVFNTKDFGIPQNRERVYIACRRVGDCCGREIFPIAKADGKALIQKVSGPIGSRVYDTNGISCTLTANGGGMGGRTGLYFVDMNANPMITESARCLTTRYLSGVSKFAGEKSGVLVHNGTKQGFDVAEPGDSIVLSYPDCHSRRGRVGKSCAQTLDTSCKLGTLADGNRIRRLTPRECFRLQGFTDEQFEKAAAVCSDTQLYKQAGNGVTVNVVYEIAKLIAKECGESG